MQDHDRGLIVGETTFGKGLVQTVYPLSENTGLALTTAKYYTPSGRLIQRDYNGVSLYDYYYNRDDKNAQSTRQPEVKITDSGRTVTAAAASLPTKKSPRRNSTLSRRGCIRSMHSSTSPKNTCRTQSRSELRSE